LHFKLDPRGVFALYVQHRSPRKKSASQKSDERKVEMWTRVLRGLKDPHTISLGEWERFIAARKCGEIDARGNEVESEKRRPVRDRAVEADCKWLHWVFNWASKWRTGGTYLMRENPIRGFEGPTEKNPHRPVATQDRFEDVRAVSDRVMMETRWGKRQTVRSYLSELLEIANGTGRRISAICQLTFDDLQLDEGGPFGSIRWPADTDKTGRETVVPMSPGVRSAMDRIQNDRPGIGAVPLFPSPEDPQKHVTRHLADKWLRKGERMAKWHRRRAAFGTPTAASGLRSESTSQTLTWRLLVAGRP